MPTRRILTLVAAALLGPWAPPLALSAAAQQPPACPAPIAASVDSAWTFLRADSLPRARPLFTRALTRCPGLPDAEVGLGFLLLRTGETAAADSLFRATVARDAANADAWEGMATVAERLRRTDDALAASRRVLAIAPGYESASARIRRLAPDADRPPIDKAARRYPELQLTMRTQGSGFELLQNGAWRPFFLHGVNLGMALPGKFPAEFPLDSALYARWLSEIAGMNANSVRIYTILPPQFYRALRAWNLGNPAKPIYVVHGVWTELPPTGDFDDPEFVKGFREDIVRTVDLLHGAADFPPRPGHAGGRYDADVSPWTVGYITGREWEAGAIHDYLEMEPGVHSVDGRFLKMEKGTAIDAWMARECDFMLAYEFDTYNSMRPIAYTNWPTTDPLKHPTESSYEEQMAFRGLKWDPEPNAPAPYDEDEISLDANLTQPTAANPAGWFASYHVYPYYPDFLLYDDVFSKAASSQGPSNYFGYLSAIKRHHAAIPLMISEFSVPSSRATAHLQPQGWDHGGLSEVDAARINARLAAEIKEVGAAGEMFFEWIDEWFKPNWFSADFEIPAENRRQWLNILSPEQNYGVIAVRPGKEGTTPMPGGTIAQWKALPVLQKGPLFGARDTTLMRVGNDEGFVYLALETKAIAGRPLPWDTLSLQIGIDTYQPGLGQLFLPGSGLRTEAGAEFLLDFRGPDDAQLLVTPEYNPYVPLRLSTGGDYFGEHFRRPIFSRRRIDAQFDSLYTLTNRPRYSRDGRFIPGSGVNLGRLVYGKGAENTLADWYYDAPAGMLQVRIPWGMLNVSDPSTAKVLFESDTLLALSPPAECPCSQLTGVDSDGFRFAVAALRPDARLAGTLPKLNPYGRFILPDLPTWRWAKWDVPTWHEYVKPTYGALRDLWATW